MCGGEKWTAQKKAVLQVQNLGDLKTAEIKFGALFGMWKGGAVWLMFEAG